MGSRVQILAPPLNSMTLAKFISLWIPVGEMKIVKILFYGIVRRINGMLTPGHSVHCLVHVVSQVYNEGSYCYL
jgi:hypothetical protein